jgi:hypothetical protein
MLARRNPDKRRSQSTKIHSTLTPSTEHIKTRRNYFRLPGHDASWTGQYITQQNTKLDSPVTIPH